MPFYPTPRLSLVCHPGAARALAATAANGGAATSGCPPEVEAALDSAVPDEYGSPDELIVWGSNQSYAGVSECDVM